MIVARRTYTYSENYEPAGPGWYSDQHYGIDNGVNLMPTMDESGDHAAGFLFHDTVEHTGDSGEGDSGTELRAIGASLMLRSGAFGDWGQADSVVSVLDEQGVPEALPSPVPVTEGWALLADNTQASADHPCRGVIRDAIAESVRDAWDTIDRDPEISAEDLDAAESGVLLECISLRADGFTRDETEESIQRVALAWIDSAAGALSRLYPEAPHIPTNGAGSVEGAWAAFRSEVEDTAGDFSILSCEGSSVTFVLRDDGSCTIECAALEDIRAGWEEEDE